MVYQRQEQRARLRHRGALEVEHRTTLLVAHQHLGVAVDAHTTQAVHLSGDGLRTVSEVNRAELKTQKKLDHHETQAMTTRRSSSLKLMPSSHALPLPAAILGWLHGYEPERGILVDFPGNRGGPLAARSLIDISDKGLQEAAAARYQAALVFENGNPELPLLIGLLRPPGKREVRVDGERIVLTGKAEIELRCGEASIVLSKTGKLVIRGAYVETRARGTNRIKGGAVQIN